MLVRSIPRRHDGSALSNGVGRGDGERVPVTLLEVAVAAGVSRSTASRALSGATAIAPDTRRLVALTADRLGYRPNRMASALRSNESRLIGMVLNNLINNSFHTIVEEVQRRAAVEGYQVLLCITDADPERERIVLNTLYDHRVDGVIVVGTGQNAAVLNAARDSGTAVVDLIRSAPDSKVPAVLAADREGAQEAVEYLLKLGHRRIGFIGGPPGTNSGDERFGGYLAALEGAELAVEDGLIRRGAFTPEFGAAAVNDLLGSRDGGESTALFVANHEAAFGALPTLAARQVRIPDDLSLICHEDIPWLQWWHPPVTVVDNGARDLGDLAMTILLEQLARQRSAAETGPGRPGRTYRVGAQLILRESCRPVH